MKPQERLTKTQKPQLFRHFLGDDYAKLPLEIRQFHEHSDQVWQGTAKITGDSNIILKLLRKLNGLPARNPEVPVTISVRYDKNREIWQRQFGESHFTSIMGFDEKKQLLFEKVGMLRFYFKLELREDESIKKIPKSFPTGIFNISPFWDAKSPVFYRRYLLERNRYLCKIPINSKLMFVYHFLVY